MSLFSQSMKGLLFGLLFPAMASAQYTPDPEDFASPVPLRRTCATEHYHTYLRGMFPDETLSMEELEANLQKAVEAGTVRNYDKTNNILTIPVVVHVVFRGINDSLNMNRIISNINSLNNDYNMENADTTLIPAYYRPRAGSVGIRFALANLDPNLQPTTGVTYTKTTVTTFSLDNTIKTTSLGGHDIWDRNNYLNIWTGRLSGSVLGYAQFPGGPAASDGVVIDYRYFGIQGTGSTAPFNRGRTTTHEVGHWLGLVHIWGDATCGSDNVNDTPVSQEANYGCPTYPHITCNNGANNNTEGGDMFMNYMDYADDRCMYMFTSGQALRMTNFLSQAPRSNLLSSYALTGNTPEVDPELAIQVYPNPSADGVFRIALDYRVRDNASVKVVNAMGAEVARLNHTAEVLDLSTQSSGIYFILLEDAKGRTYSRKLVIQ